ncbi:MAG: signal transduction histidine kinase/CheY-like chemotaxis protein [Candidatus Azotimanducaceae bacterium]|jgi:signal transduction histidine kinase/CheY-like chemotaxis protein
MFERVLRSVALAIYFGVCASPISASPAPLDLATTPSGTEVSASLTFLKDETQNLDLQDLRGDTWSKKFTPLEGQQQFSRASAAYWFKLTLTNSDQNPHEKLLVLGYPSHHLLDFYDVNSDDDIRSMRRDAYFPLNEVDIQHRLPIYSVAVKSGETKTVYLRISSPTIRTNMEVWNVKDFIQHDQVSEWWLLVFLGVILAAFIYSVVIAAATPSALNISLALMTMMMLCTQFTLHGHAYQILGNAGGTFNLAWLFIQCCTCASVALFSYYFLNGAHMARGIRYAIFALITGYLLAGIISLVDYRIGLLAAQPLLISGPVFLMAAAIHQLLRKDRNAIIYLAAWLPIMLLALFIALIGFGLFGYETLGPALVSAWIPTTIIVFVFCVIFRTRAEYQESTGKSTFLAILSHEVRTPLTGILGTVSLLEQSPLNARQRNLVDNLRNSGNALVTLLDDVLQLSRYEAGKVSELSLAAADPTELTRSMVALMAARSESKGVAIDFKPFSDLPSAVILDEPRLRQILLNLISNAVKFSDAGQIDVELSATQASDGYVSLKFLVKDEGIGIPADKLPTLFEPYERIDGAKREGTGLGLFISQQLVELMGGSISVTSEPGHGSCFSFEIYAEIADASALAPKLDDAISPVVAEGQHLLLVDDVAINRDVISELLRNTGFSVTTAENGTEALALVEDRQFDALLLDVYMPGMSGLEVAQQERARHFTGPIIGLTATTDPKVVTECLASGMNQVFRKPVDISALTACIVDLIGGEFHSAALALDDRVLETLQAAVGKDRCDELCRQAMVSLRDHLDRLIEAVGHEDNSTTAAVAHGLAGCALSVGLEHLGREAEKLSRQLLNQKELLELEERVGEISRIAEEGMLALQSARPI